MRSREVLFKADCIKTANICLKNNTAKTAKCKRFGHQINNDTQTLTNFQKVSDFKLGLLTSQSVRNNGISRAQRV